MEDVLNEYTPILPPGDVEIDFDTINCVPDGNEVEVVGDAELSREVFEIGDESSLCFPTNSSNYILSLFIKSMGKFLQVNAQAVDETGTRRKIIMSNKRSTVAVDKTYCKLPLNMGFGWQYLEVNLDDVLSKCFGVSVASVREIEIKGPARIARIYLQKRSHADAELPTFLRLIN